ncbi:acetoacetate--CoA ligase [Amycolatopsis pithecellobii]|uniref:Acetoacetate--CoA ligase n=1 Tax=Amycolatopsis pithecellobii TaxID=664692 RepID=A0A6N7ZBX4_9PSEU|nr:acetoacetate--CoA ligase [Amycolatopsis pithecellobii]MTD59218.1 acetoacetate--CoA ligase [Amycolatopsis pithecellobii]
MGEPATATPETPLWVPGPEVVERANLTAFARWAGERRGRSLRDYGELLDWSTERPAEFWSDLLVHFGVVGAVRDAEAHPAWPGEGTWFPRLRTNFAGHILRQGLPTEPAIIAVNDGGGRCEVSWDELRNNVAGIRGELSRAGVGSGDVVVGYLPNVPAAPTAFLAAAGLGAIWALAGQDLSGAAVAQRFGQLSPTVLVAAAGYSWAGSFIDRRDDIRLILARIPSVRTVILVEPGGPLPDTDTTVVPWADAVAGEPADPIDDLPADHPLWVMFTSGTTGRPKGIVHSHGGILAEQLKSLALQWDLRAGDHFSWFTSPSWVMWNILVSGLAVGTSVVLYDGSPTYPTASHFWDVAQRENAAVVGASPGYLERVRSSGGALAGVSPSLRALGVTGSPLPADLHHWVREQVPEAPLISMSGGTEVATAFCGGAMTLSVRAGRIPAPCLGVAMQAWDTTGREVFDVPGELVVRNPMPSMPLRFWADEDGRRLHETYFARFPGVWAHGDLVTVHSTGTVEVHGRSDATLNRGGVRIGTAEIYSVVERVQGVHEVLVVGVDDDADHPYWIPMFVVPVAGSPSGRTPEDDEELVAAVRRAIRSELSRRHEPDHVFVVTALPHTKTGKKVEVPVKRLLQGGDPREVASLESFDDHEAYLDLAHYIAKRPVLGTRSGG